MDKTARTIERPMLALLLVLMAAVTSYSADRTQPPSAGPPPPVVLTDGQDRYALGTYMEILEDPSGELTIKEVSSPAFNSRFVASQDAVPNYGFTDSAYWVRLPLENPTDQTAERLLEVGFANMHFVDLYIPSPNGTDFTVKQTGALRPFTSRDIAHPRIVFEVAVPPESQESFYLRFENGASMTLPLSLWTADAFALASLREYVLRGLFYGALFALLVYNLFVLFSLRERSYLYLSLLLASMVFFEASYTGYTEAYLFPQLY